MGNTEIEGGTSTPNEKKADLSELLELLRDMEEKERAKNPNPIPLPPSGRISYPKW